MQPLTTIFLTFVGLSLTAFAQLPGTEIESHPVAGNDADLIEKAGKLREAGKLMKAPQVEEQLKTPVPEPVELAAANKQPLKGREIAEKAKQGFVRIGYYYLCKHCDHWHLNLAGGYVVGKQVVVTCHHVIKPGDDMREGYLIAVDHEDTVLPVTSVLASNDKMDTAVVRINGGNSQPLGLSDAVTVGDPAYCYSFPLGQRGYFSDGIVNRFYWKNGKKGEGEGLSQWIPLRVNVSTDWAPGSSGAAIVDEFGNAIGHVDTISPLSEGPRRPAKEGEKKPKDRFNGATLITLHEAIPARSIMALLATLPQKAAP